MIEDLKTCRLCKETKPKNAFGKKTKAKDGLNYECKDCVNWRAKDFAARNKEKIKEYKHQYHLTHLEQDMARHRRWRLNNPEKAKMCDERSAKRSIVWRREHLEYRVAYEREYHKAHAKREIEKTKAWAKAHPDQVKIQYHKRRARIINALISDLTVEQWKAIKVLYGHKCAYCGKKPKRLTMDHVVPLARGGNHTASNIVPACRPCNAKKNVRAAPTHQQHFLGILA